MKTYAIVVAGGKGNRFGAGLPKQFFQVGGKTVLNHCLARFQEHDGVDEVILVTNADYREISRGIVEVGGFNKVKHIVDGGSERLNSTANGVAVIEDDEAKVLIHDVVRPFVSDRILTECIDALDEHRCVDVAVDVIDTIIRIDDDRKITEVPDKRYMKRGQTPQCFQLSLIREAHKRALADETVVFSDDCGPVMHYALAPIYVVAGEEENFKITHPGDVVLAEKVLRGERL